MAKIERDGRKIYWLDEDGNKVLRKFIDKHIQKRDKVVEDVFSEVDDLNNRLQGLKLLVQKKVSEFLETAAGDYGEKWQGNTALFNFSKNLSVEVAISKRIEFDERLQIAKQKIDNYLISLTKEANKDLVLLINKVFKVDNKGNVDVKQILSLRTIKIEHPNWLEAMNLINESISIESTKTYFNFKRKNAAGKWEHVTLNFSAM